MAKNIGSVPRPRTLDAKNNPAPVPVSQARPTPNAWAQPLLARNCDDSTPTPAPSATPLLPACSPLLHPPPLSHTALHPALNLECSVNKPAVPSSEASCGIPEESHDIAAPSLRLSVIRASNLPAWCSQQQRELRNLRARLNLEKTETPADRELRVHWEVVVCAIEALDMYNWELYPEAAAWVGPKRRRYGARWHECKGSASFLLIPSELYALGSDVRASAAKDIDGDGTEANRLVARNPEFIQEAYRILLTERQGLRQFPLSLSLDHPWITKLQVSTLCERLGVPAEALAVIVAARKMGGRTIFKDF
ncbi:hypothetical protein C8R47DRAFT_441313 [Mycena vitilis]|nr:hypothetical protein C8R47DRAFT_441313 [Mycena vitilis]